MKVSTHLNFPKFLFDLCLCCGFLKELMIWASLPDGQAQTKTPPTFGIVLWYTEWCHILLCSLFQNAFKSFHTVYNQLPNMYTQICVYECVICHAIYEYCSLFPNFLHISFQQSIMQDFKSIIQHIF